MTPASPPTPGVATKTLGSAVLAEFLGTAFLLAGVIGSGIMAEQLTDDVGLQLLQNALATAGVLIALILTFAGASGAHFNPVVTLVEWALGDLEVRWVGPYLAAQTAGGIIGAIAANLMFDLPAIELSTKDRLATHLVFAEVVATLGLLLIIFGTVRSGKGNAVAFAVGGYIAGAYYFTSSTSFANPAVTIARMFSDTFAGIEPQSAPFFIAAQLFAAVMAFVAIRALYPAPASPDQVDRQR